MDDDVSDLLPDLGASRFAGRDDLAAALLVLRGEAGNLRGFSAAFGPFERDEFSSDSVLQRHGWTMGFYFQFARKVSRW